MGFSFGIAEVRKWAQFSHDYNPVHFDISHAKLAGLDFLIVHGMLALLPVKQAITAALREAAGDRQGWTKFRALFRSPIPHGESNELSLAAAKNVVNFRLRSKDTGQEYFRGSYGISETPLYTTDDMANITRMDAAAINQRLAQFNEYYPDIRERWVAWDAIIFSEFIRTKLAVIEQASKKHFGSHEGGNTADKVVVQISHTAYVRSDLVGEDIKNNTGSGGLSYSIGKPELIKNENELVGTVTLGVCVDNDPIMKMELGLMMKTGVVIKP